MEFENAEPSLVIKPVGLLIRDKDGVNHAVTVYVSKETLELLKPGDSPVIIEVQGQKKMSEEKLKVRAQRLNRRLKRRSGITPPR